VFWAFELSDGAGVPSGEGQREECQREEGAKRVKCESECAKGSVRSDAGGGWIALASAPNRKPKEVHN
jgi:hypothetical protein